MIILINAVINFNEWLRVVFFLFTERDISPQLRSHILTTVIIRSKKKEQDSHSLKDCIYVQLQGSN